MASIPNKAADKTSRVSRQPQYKRNRASNPLTPLNQKRTSQRPVNTKEKYSHSVYTDIPQTKAICDDLGSMSVRFLDAMGKENISSVPLQNSKESRVLNKTLSPISTPERFSNPLMSRFQSPLPVICKPDKVGHSSRQILSVKDALAVINSDLSCPVSPPNACSSLNLADSLESDDQSVDGKLETDLNVDGDVSLQIDLAQPRLTYFVKSDKVLGDGSGPEGLVHSPEACSATDNAFYNGTSGDKLNQADLKPKKIVFNSSTVIKSKAVASPEHSPNTRTVRTFRRRLLQKAPLVSSSPDSNTSLLAGVSVLPVINSDACVNLKFLAAPPLLEPEPVPPASTHTAVQPTISRNDENNTNCAASSDRNALDIRTSPCHVSEDLFPVLSHATNRSRKRKSEEYLRDSNECLTNGPEGKVKHSADVTHEYKKSCPDNQVSSRCKQIQSKRSGE